MTQNSGRNVPLTAVAMLVAAASAQATIINYSAFLDGPSESPPNGSPATGQAFVDIDTVLHTMRVQISFSGLLGTTTASHIHAATALPGVGTAGVATQTPTFTGFPTGVTAGSYDHTFDMTLTSSYNASFVTANGGTAASAEAALFGAIAAGKAYVNVHTTAFGGGEIRGFLTPVPAPGAASVLALGGLLAVRRRRA